VLSESLMYAPPETENRSDLMPPYHFREHNKIVRNLFIFSRKLLFSNSRN